MSNFKYYKLSLKLRSPMLGTCTDVSIYHEHVLQKAKKEIAKANKLSGKIAKSMEKYVGSNISEDKEIKELQGVLRAYSQVLGKQVDVPDTVEDILQLAETFKEELEESLKEGDSVKATVFQKDPTGHAIVSTHMILGNLKENLKIIVNSGNKEIVKSKVAVGEALALDVKMVEDFMRPSRDILRGDIKLVNDLPVMAKGRWIAEKSGRIILERPIRFERMGKQETAIAMSEAIPQGAEMSCTLRVRDGSVLSEEHLRTLLDMGKNNGLGSWRGSGNMGAYMFKLEVLPDYVESIEEGWS